MHAPTTAPTGNERIHIFAVSAAMIGAAVGLTATAIVYLTRDVFETELAVVSLIAIIAATPVLRNTRRIRRARLCS